MCLRSGFLPALVKYAGSTVGAAPRLTELVGAKKFRRRRSVGTRRRRESLRTFWRLIKTHESCTLNTTGVEHASLGSECGL
jgi:hypothetical protein